MKDQPKPIGRPPLADRSSVRVTITMRLPSATRERIVDFAADHGRSMSEEIERRIEQSFLTDDAMRVIRETVRQEMRAEFAARGQYGQERLGSLGQLGWNPSTQQLPHQTYAYNGYPGQNCDRHTSFQGSQPNAQTYMVRALNSKG